MPNYTQGSTRVAFQQPDFTAFQNNGSAVLDSRRTRPLWFDGRFMAARDLDREQNYFLQREADLGQAPGFGVLSGLMVQIAGSSQSITIQAGAGVTPAGEMVSVTNDLTVPISSLAVDQNLSLQIGVATIPLQNPNTRSGIYVIGLRPYEYTADPITEYPTTVSGPRTTHDGDIVEVTVVAMQPYPSPAAAFAASQQQAALARQIFLSGNPATLPDYLLPLALVGLQQGRIAWLDPYLVRRDAGAQFAGVHFGLTDPATQQAYLAQYDLQLQAAVASRQASGLKANFAASDIFQSLPPAGRFPLDGIDTSAFSQVFFPQQMDVRLSLFPQEYLAALLNDSLSLPAIDLTLAQNAYANMAVFAFIPVPLASFATLANALPTLTPNPTLPQVLANRQPIELLRLYQGSVNFTVPTPVQNNAWASAIGSQTYGFYIRRASNGTQALFTTPVNVVVSSSLNPSVETQPVTFTAEVTPASTTGSIQFLDGPNTLGNGGLAEGAASFTTSSLSAGTHPITAVYPGDAENAANTSNTFAQVVTKALTTTGLTSSPDPSNVGEAVTFAAAVTPNAATGSVRFLEGANLLSTQTLASGAAQFTTSALTLGAHIVHAEYMGDINYADSVSANVTQNVIKAPSTTTLGTSGTPATVTHSVTFTASVAPATATGNVQFSDGATILGSVALSAGSAAFSTSSLAVGTHSISATYAGDAAVAASSSTPLAQVITDIASSVLAGSSQNPSAFGAPVVFSAKVTPATATGAVTFSDGGLSIGTANLAGGVASLPPISNLTVGAHTITAHYGGDAADAPSDSAPMTQTVNKLGSSVVVTSTPNPLQVGDGVAFTANVTPSAATGTVEFFDSATSLGKATIVGGAAKLTGISTLAAGAHAITAQYGGDNTDGAATSAPITQTVNKLASTTSLDALPNPATLGQAVSATVKVTPASALGTVTVTDNGAAAGSGTLASGQAVLTLAQLVVGTHTLVASYSGDANTNPSASPAVAVVVNRAATQVQLAASPNPATWGQPVGFTAKLTPASATGVVQFMSDGAAVASSQLAGGAASSSTSTLAPGTHTLTASYGGDNNNAPSTSPPATQTINKAATQTGITAPNASGLLGASASFTATVGPATASGNVDFLDSGKVIGTAALKGGQAVFATTSLATGAHTITAAYQGDANFNASSSGAFTYTVVILTIPTTLRPPVIG